MRFSFRRFVVGVAGVALATMGMPSPASAAGAAGSPDWLQVVNGVTYESCNHVPYSLKPLSDWSSAQAHAWGNLFGYYNYEVDMTVLGPDGTEADSDWVHRTADDVSNSGDDTGEFFVCDGAGTYVTQVAGWWCPLNFTPTTRPDDCQTIQFSKSFSMRAAKTTTVVRPAAKSISLAKTKSLKVNSFVKVERSTGTFAFADEEVTLQYRKGRRWVKWDSRWTDSRGKASFKVRFAGPGKFKLRAKVASDDYYAGSTSPVVTVRVTR